MQFANLTQHDPLAAAVADLAVDRERRLEQPAGLVEAAQVLVQAAEVGQRLAHGDAVAEVAADGECLLEALRAPPPGCPSRARVTAIWLSRLASSTRLPSARCRASASS